MPTYNYARASNLCPTPMSPAGQAQVNRQDLVAIHSPYIEPLDTVVSTPTANCAAALDLAGRFGGGGYAICRGLDLSQSVNGTVIIAIGQWNMDGIGELKVAGSAALTSSQPNYVWIQNTGVPIAVSNSLTPPTTPAVYLGRVVVSGAGAITDYDLSGVFYMRGGMVYRKTGDTGLPDDTPPATMGFLTESANDVYLWTGTEHLPLSTRVWSFATLDMNNANTTPAASVYHNRYLKISSTTPFSAKRDLILPLVAGLELAVWNGQAGAFAVRVIGASGTGIDIAQSRIATVWCDGTNWRRRTPDLDPTV